MGGRSASSSSAPFRRGSTLDPIPFSRKVGGFVFGGANDWDVLLGFDSPGRGPDTLPGATGKEVIGLNLDLTLRSRFDTSLDGYMRAVWQQFGKPEVAYTVDDLEQTLGAFTGDREFAADFFTRYVRGTEVPDYEVLLANAGFLLRRARPDAPWLGISLRDDRRGVLVPTTPSAGGPAYEAGIARGDHILRIAGNSVSNVADVGSVLQGLTVGDRVEVALQSRNGEKTVVVEIGANQQLEVVTYEAAGMEVMQNVKDFRESWLSSKAGRD